MATGLQPKHLKGLDATLVSELAIVAIKYRSLSQSILDGVLNSAGSQAIGIAGEYTSNPHKPLSLSGLAFATGSLILVIETDRLPGHDLDDEGVVNHDVDSEDELDGSLLEGNNFKSALASILATQDRTLLAFNAERLALGLYNSLDLRISNLIDLQSSVESTKDLARHSPKAYYTHLGGLENVNPVEFEKLFKDELRRAGSFHALAFRAFSAFLAQRYNDIDE